MKQPIKKYPLGSEWRRWDLHIHTKDTNKNDNFNSTTFEDYCSTLFKKAFEKGIAVIGITDYFSIDNYIKALEYQCDIEKKGGFTTEEKDYIKNILLLPNVELRMIPVTDSRQLVNIHCIFNPEIVKNLDNEFFNEIKHSAGSGSEFPLNRNGLTLLGASLDKTLVDDLAKYKKGVENFIVTHERLQKLYDTNKNFKENVIIVVSNSSKDGASAFQKHFELFENTDAGSLDGLRKAIYSLSNAIFSSNPNDISYFLGEKVDDVSTVIDKCGSLKPCIHGSDAHCEDDLFEPKEKRYCWIKADPTFDGLKQIIYEPDSRVYIGESPELIERVKNNKTQYIDSLNIRQKKDKKAKFGTWFDNITIPFNKGLVTIIGNKGSGKSAISDIIGLLGDTKNAGKDHSNFTFLNNTRNQKRFRQTGFSENFEAELKWVDGTSSIKSLDADIDLEKSLFEKIRYLPQNYFEKLTNEIAGENFSTTLNEVIFKHIPESERFGTETFEDLQDFRFKTVEGEVKKLKNELDVINQNIIKLEQSKSSINKSKLTNQIAEKQKVLDEHLKIEPATVEDPTKVIGKKEKVEKDQKLTQLGSYNKEIEELNQKIVTIKSSLNSLKKDQEELKQFNAKLSSFKNEIEVFLKDNSEIITKNKLNLTTLLLPVDLVQIAERSKTIQVDISSIENQLKDNSALEIEYSNLGENELNVAKASSLSVKLEKLIEQRNKLKNDLTEPERQYQEYKEKHAVWENKKEEIEGDLQKQDSLNFFKGQIDYINKDLEDELKKSRESRIAKSIEIYNKKKELLTLFMDFKKSIDNEINKDKEFTKKFNMTIEASFVLDSNFASSVLNYIDQSQGGTFYGINEGEKELFKIIEDKDLHKESDIKSLLNEIIESLDFDRRQDKKHEPREITKQVNDIERLYNNLFSLDYIKPNYELKLDGKRLQELSPGEKGALLLVFYLLIDAEEIPLVIDQPEDNLDNKSVFEVLTHFIKFAKNRRQIILVTHNPNLAIGADAEQIVYVNLDKKNNYVFSYISGGIEDLDINNKTVEVLEGTMPAFNKRRLKYNK